MTISRRSLITGLVSLVAAPAIIKVSSLMPVKVIEPVANVDLVWTLYQEVMQREIDKLVAKISDDIMTYGTGYSLFDGKRFDIVDPAEVHQRTGLAGWIKYKQC